ncbi:MAG TPA: alpha-ketoacid dehydrogenase subunit beta, partial [Planctomycetota bacterium]|nr:alpha-ketoacid dehydrogenase subunit beta [Planctomycetota bacterium]
MRTETSPLETVTYIDAVARALRDEMRRDSKVFILGQDVAEYGGAFKVTQGFIEEFGANRVVNTPISESGTLGMAIGAALLGHRPIVEMQFADFISCGFNQIVNVAAKMYWRTGSSVPLVIRCPTGGGGGGGAFHSQCVEAWFLHTPGLKVVAPAWPGDAYDLLRASIRDPNPVLYFEHKHLYRRV